MTARSAPWVKAAVAAALLASCARADGLRLETVATGLDRPVDLTAPPGDARLFVVEQSGRVRIVDRGRVLARPFLDLSRDVSGGSEQGLLGLAFHPDYARNRTFFVNYTDRAGDTRVVRYRTHPETGMADPASAALVLRVDQPYSNHNGGQVLFGPDGMLYVPLGDGGSGGDPHGNGQNLGTLLGKIVRIDVDGTSPYAIPAGNPFAGRRDARAEIWAYGLRNPWRVAFDPTGEWLYVADVGQNQWEEIDVVPARRGGRDFGWNALEGSHCYGAPRCDTTGRVAPAFEYSHRDGCSITGGRVYRGSVAALRGLYFYADYCDGWIESLRWSGGRVTERRRWPLRQRLTPSAFGEDARGELYVLDHHGRVLRIAGVD